MTTPIKRFGFKKRDSNDLPKVVFDLQEGGRVYECKQQIDGLQLLSIMAAMNEDSPTDAANAILDFFKHIMDWEGSPEALKATETKKEGATTPPDTDEAPVPSQYEVFRSEVASLGLQMDELNDVIAHLLGTYTDFPTT